MSSMAQHVAVGTLHSMAQHPAHGPAACCQLTAKLSCLCGLDCLLTAYGVTACRSLRQCQHHRTVHASMSCAAQLLCTHQNARWRRTHKELHASNTTVIKPATISLLLPPERPSTSTLPFCLVALHTPATSTAADHLRKLFPHYLTTLSCTRSEAAPRTCPGKAGSAAAQPCPPTSITGSVGPTSPCAPPSLHGFKHASFSMLHKCTGSTHPATPKCSPRAYLLPWPRLYLCVYRNYDVLGPSLHY
jgi:hypothetical protein